MKKIAKITAIEYYLPTLELENEQLAKEFDDWSATKILEKTGICLRKMNVLLI
jgi:hypothetical protein